MYHFNPGGGYAKTEVSTNKQSSSDASRDVEQHPYSVRTEAVSAPLSSKN